LIDILAVIFSRGGVLWKSALLFPRFWVLFCSVFWWCLSKL